MSMKKLLVVISVLSVFGCSSGVKTELIYYPSGERALRIQCGPTISHCEDVAGQMCKERGYIIHEDYYSQARGDATRTMVITCK